MTLCNPLPLRVLHYFKIYFILYKVAVIIGVLSGIGILGHFFMLFILYKQ